MVFLLISTRFHFPSHLCTPLSTFPRSLRQSVTSSCVILSDILIPVRSVNTLFSPFVYTLPLVCITSNIYLSFNSLCLKSVFSLLGIPSRLSSLQSLSSLSGDRYVPPITLRSHQATFYLVHLHLFLMLTNPALFWGWVGGRL